MKAKSKNDRGVVAVATPPKDPVLAAALKKTAAIKAHPAPPPIAPLPKKLLREAKKEKEAPPPKPVKIPAKVAKANEAKLKEGGRVAALTKKAVSNIAATVAAGLKTGTKAPEVEPGARKKNKPKPVPAPKASKMKAKASKPEKAKREASGGIYDSIPALRALLKKPGEGWTTRELRYKLGISRKSIRKLFKHMGGVKELPESRYKL